MDEQSRYQEAKKQVGDIKDFYIHLLTYLIANIFLIIVNLLTSPAYFWFIWPLLGWSIGLIIHGITVFGGLWGKSWEERKIKEIMEKNNHI